MFTLSSAILDPEITFALALRTACEGELIRTMAQCKVVRKVYDALDAIVEVRIPHDRSATSLFKVAPLRTALTLEERGQNWSQAVEAALKTAPWQEVNL